MGPDSLDELFGEIGSHEATGPMPRFRSGRLIGFVDHVSDPGEGGVVVGEESAECAVDGWFVGKKAWKWKRRRSAASTMAMDRSAFIVPMIHRFFGRENGVGVLEIGGLVPVFKEEEQFAEHFDKFARLISSITMTYRLSGS